MNQNTTNEAKKKVKFSELWQQKRFRSIFISAAIILLCLVVYLVLLFTVLKPEEKEEFPTVGNHGEQMESGRPFVIPPVEADLMQSIKVENELGSYRYYKGEDGQYYFEGAEMMYYDQTSDWMDQSSQEDLSDILQSVSMVDSLVNLVRYMLATEEVVGYNKENLSAYGLNDGGKASVTLTYLDQDGNEKTSKVLFGNKTVSGSGYYVMAEGRDALYILMDTYITRCIFADVKDYLLPQVAPSVSSTTYMELDELVIKKKGQKFVSIRQLNEEEKKETADLFSHIFSFPEGYYPSDEKLQAMLETFISFTGEEVVEFNITSRLSDLDKVEEMQDLFRLYSLVDSDNNWNYELYYKYDNFDITLYISEKLEVTGGNEGEKEFIYYVYSPDFDLIAEFKAEKLAFVEWDLLNLLDNHSFFASIDQVATIEMYYGDTNAKFSLQGEGENLKVTSSSGVKVETDNFRQLYKAILYTTTDGYADQPEDASEILRVCITLRNGKVYDYSFYGLTARKAYYTLNGSGEFYINRDYVKQLIYACDGILKGEEITVDRKN